MFFGRDHIGAEGKSHIKSCMTKLSGKRTEKRTHLWKAQAPKDQLGMWEYMPYIEEYLRFKTEVEA